jgi:single-strand DNA-binding protein
MIIGNLLNDPETSIVTEKQIPVINFKIASNKKFKNQQGIKKDKVCFVNIVAWSKLADICQKNLKKGDGVFVEGELQTRVFIPPQTEIRITTVEILASRIQFLTKKQQQHLEEIEEIEHVDTI